MKRVQEILYGEGDSFLESYQVSEDAKDEVEDQKRKMITFL